MFSVIILCAGKGQRMGIEKNKILLPIDDKPMFMHSLEVFLNFSDDVTLVCSENDINLIKKIHSNVVIGGLCRQDSVYNGILNAKNEYILIHDGARPYIKKEDVERLIEEGKENYCAFLGSDISNSIKEKGTFANVDRDKYVMAYTPQLVRKTDYILAYNKAKEINYITTDDVSLVSEMLNIPITYVRGSNKNIKITTKEDYLPTKNYRIGHSWDTHKLVNGRKLILGGIEIPFEKGLLGHSDADALLHAIAESLLGALSLGDLGTHFSDKDPKYKDIDSKQILKKVYEMVLDAGYEIINIDTMVYAEEPKMKPYIYSMRKKISEVLSIDIAQISIKATTYEHMDAIGRGEAIAADSTVLLGKIL